MAGDAAERLMTVEEFLLFEGEPDTRYELVNGRLRAMAPATLGHAAITVNLSTALRNRLKPPCRPYAEAGLRLPGRDDLYYVGDVVVSCRPQSGRQQWIEDPILVVEILSRSTRSHDRGQKAPDYATIPSVGEILLVDSERRWVQLWTRRDDGWFLRDFIGDSSVPLGCLDATLTLDDIYDGVAVE